jgi:hypothetical protein
MPDNINDEAEIEVDETQGIDDEIDVQVGDEPEPKPDIVTMKPDELAALRAQADTAKAVRDGIEGLASKFAQPQVQVPVNAPTQTPEEFYAEHSDDLFDKEKGPKVLAQFQDMVFKRDYGPVLQGMTARIGTLTKENLKATDPYFKDYENEVEALVKAQPANVQALPDVYDRAWMTIREKHRSEIEQKSIDAKVDERLNAKLKELGIESDAVGADKKPPVNANSAARAQGGGASATKPVLRFKTEDDKQKAIREAERRGLSLGDYMRSRGAN